MKNIYISIAGYIIQISIYNSNSSDRLENDIKDLYQSFIITRKSTKINFFIEIYNKPFNKPIKIISQTVNNRVENYLYFFEEYGNKIKTFYYISINQFVSILIIALQKLLVESQSFMLHASAVSFKNWAIIFTGTSGAGKSTIIKQLENKYRAIADDTIIIKKENNNYYCYQTPFIEKNYWFRKENKRFKIKKLYLLEKVKYYRIKKISNKKSLITKFANQLFTNNKNLKKQIKDLLDFTNTFDEFHHLYFKKDSDPNRLKIMLENDIRK